MSVACKFAANALQPKRMRHCSYGQVDPTPTAMNKMTWKLLKRLESAEGSVFSRPDCSMDKDKPLIGIFVGRQLHGMRHLSQSVHSLILQMLNSRVVITGYGNFWCLKQSGKQHLTNGGVTIHVVAAAMKDREFFLKHCVFVMLLSSLSL